MKASRKGEGKVGGSREKEKERLNGDYRRSINSLWSKKMKRYIEKKNLVNDSINGDLVNLRCSQVLNQRDCVKEKDH